MNYKSIFFSVFTLCFFVTQAQEMDTGFSFLETGKYPEAILFFKEILSNYPKNRTAKLCYARAIGLNGNPQKAIEIFTSLKEAYPNDYEIKLNFAESLLWNKQYDKAVGFYEQLVKENSKSFPALLGYANTFSNLKQYDEAKKYVEKALLVSPDNPTALISKKYIHLGAADKAMKAQDYTTALDLLNENLEFFDNDKETLLNLANLYLMFEKFDLAEETYRRLEANPQGKFSSLNGLSLVAHLKNKDSKALQISARAFQQLKTLEDEKLITQTVERYIQALIWNKKYSEANQLIKETKRICPNENWVLSLEATLAIYKSNFNKSIETYQKILKNDSLSFDGNLGIANAQRAYGLSNEAYKSADKTLTIFNNQKDALQFLKSMNQYFTPFIDTKTLTNFDNGNNEAYVVNSQIEYPFSTRIKLIANYLYRTTNNTITQDMATTHNGKFGFSYQLLRNLTFKGLAGVSKASTSKGDYEQLISDVSLEFKPFSLQNIELKYQVDLQNFNATLLGEKIVQHNYFVNYSVNTNFNLGSYSQYVYTNQSDANIRNIFFTSLYYNFFYKPVFKFGINYQNMSFKNQLPLIYFSPDKFYAGEIFINLIKNEKIAKSKSFYYEFFASLGYQFIDDAEKQNTYRLNGTFGYKFSDRLLMNVFGTHTNNASSTVSGFTFSEIGFRFKWYLFSKPVFRKTMF